MEELHIKDVTLDEQQEKAVELCVDFKHRLAAVTGAAGTGKTTIIRQVAAALRARGTTFAVSAPTGKAARRITEATGLPAVTIHKLLEYNRPGERDPETGEPLDATKPKRDRSNPLDVKVVIVDEYAMVNYELHNNLMAALPSGGVLRAFGDVYQLPPIDKTGGKLYDSRKTDISQTPFQKLLAREDDSITLEHVYRQAEGSNILENADRIRRGWNVPVNQDLGDFYVKITGETVPTLRKYVLEQLEKGVNFRSIENQIITPSKKSSTGTQKLNEVLRALLNPSPEQTLSLPRHEYDKDPVTIGLGDKVVCTENTYDLRDYFERYAEWSQDMKPYEHSYIPCPITKQMLNGETGIVTQIYPDGSIDVDFGDRIVEIPSVHSEYWAKRETIIDAYPLRNISLAYALTTHKCQGSEFINVIYVLNRAMQFAESRQNFYTGITRARERVVVFTDQTSLQTSLRKVIR